MDGIKMGTRDTGSQVKKEELKNGIKINKITMDKSGSNLNQIQNSNKNSKLVEEKLPLVILDSIKIARLIDMAVADLSVKRLLKFKGSDTEIMFIKEYNPRSRIIKFNYSISEINEMLNTSDQDLSDFFLTFMFKNIRTYIKNEYNARPESLPIIGVDEAGMEIPNTIIINIR